MRGLGMKILRRDHLKRITSTFEALDKCVWEVGPWKHLSSTEPLQVCQNGYHFYEKIPNSPTVWTAAEKCSVIALIEHSGETLSGRGESAYITDSIKTVCRKMRIVATWEVRLGFVQKWSFGTGSDIFRESSFVRDFCDLIRRPPDVFLPGFDGFSFLPHLGIEFAVNLPHLDSIAVRRSEPDER